MLFKLTVIWILAAVYTEQGTCLQYSVKHLPADGHKRSGEMASVTIKPPEEYCVQRCGLWSGKDRCEATSTGENGTIVYRALSPYSPYNVTVWRAKCLRQRFVTNPPNSPQDLFFRFRSDIGDPQVAAVSELTAEASSDSIHVSWDISESTNLNGPPSGFTLRLCPSDDRNNCQKFETPNLGYLITDLQPNRTYILNCSIFNIDSFNKRMDSQRFVTYQIDTLVTELSFKGASVGWIIVAPVIVAVLLCVSVYIWRKKPEVLRRGLGWRRFFD